MNLFSKNKYIFLIFLTALALRLVYLSEIRHTPVVETQHVDAKWYYETALNIVNGDILGDSRVFFMAPLYPYVLAIIFFIFGKSVFSALIFQIIIGSISCILIYLIALKFFNKRTAILSGLIAAIYPVFIFYDALLLKENLMILSTLLFILIYPFEDKIFHAYTFNIKRKITTRDVLLFLSGVLIGIHSLLRPNIFLIIPLLLFYEYLNSRNIIYLFEKYAILSLGILLFVFPVAARNKIVGNEFVVTVASGGMNFWTGNNPLANGTYSGAPFITSEEPQYEDEDFRKEASKRMGKELTTNQSSSFWFKEGFRFISSYPRRYLVLLYRKFLAFFINIELPIDLSYYFAKDFSKFLKLNFLSYGMIVPFALVGIYYSLKLRKGNYVLLLLIVYNLLSSLIFFTSSRYRLPVVPIFIIYASFFASVPKPVYSIPFLVLFFIFVNQSDAIFTSISNKSLSYVNTANYYIRDSKFDKAEEMLKKALEIDPTRSNVYRVYAELMNKKGNKEESENYFKKAIFYDGNLGESVSKPQDNLEIAYKLFMEKKYDEALKLFTKLLPENPKMEKELRNNIGLCYLKLGKYIEAEKEFKSAVSLDKNYDKGYYNMGLLFEKKGDKLKAEEFYKKTLLINPAHTMAKKKLGK